MASDDVATLIKEVRRNGFTVEIGEGGIGKVLWKGEPVYKHEQDGGTPLTIHQTPGDHRWRKNMVPIFIRAKVLEKDPWSNHTERKLTVTPETSRSFVANQLRPWVQRRFDEGFTQAVLANAIHTRWPDVGPTQNAVAVALSQFMGEKQRGLTAKKHEAWKRVIEDWTKQPELPPASKRQSSNGNGEVVSLAEAFKAGPHKVEVPQGFAKPSIPLSARMLAMMMDSYPDRDEALLLHLELVELEELIYAMVAK